MPRMILSIGSATNVAPRTGCRSRSGDPGWSLNSPPHYRGDREAAIRAVNREEGDRKVCGVISVAFLRGPHIAAASHADMAFEILRILVVGVNTDSGIHAVPPVSYFAAFGVVEYDV